MTIDTRGKWWKGSGFEDLSEYVRGLTADGYPATVVRQSRCMCGTTRFSLEVDCEQGGARRTCIACRAPAWLLDSEEHEDELELELVVCPCGNGTFEVGVGYSLRERGGDVKWVTVGERCAKCGILGAPVDWKIDYSPTDHLLEKS